MKASTVIWVLAMSVLHAQIYITASRSIFEDAKPVRGPETKTEPEVALFSPAAPDPASTTTVTTTTPPAPLEFDGDIFSEVTEVKLADNPMFADPGFTLLTFGVSTTEATTTPPTTETPTTVPLPKSVPDHINERVVDEEKLEMAFEKPLIYKSFDCSHYPSDCKKPRDGKITFIPPKGHGLVAIVQELSLRTNSDVCRFGHGFYPKCMKCVEYLQFSTATKRSDRTCGDVDVHSTEGPLMTIFGEVSFVGGVDQELVIELHQEEAFGLDAPPSFVISITPYNDCHQNINGTTNASASIKKCPPSRNGAEESFCIYDELFCDRVVNCPVAGPLSSTFGFQTDESNCHLDFLEELDAAVEESAAGGEVLTPLGMYDDDDESYEIKPMPMFRPKTRLGLKAGFAYRKHTKIVQLPMYPDAPDMETPEDMQTLPRATAEKKSETWVTVSKWLRIGAVVVSFICTGIVVRCCLIRCMALRTKQPRKGRNFRYFVPQKATGYTKLDTFSYQVKPIKVKVPKEHLADLATPDNPEGKKKLFFGVGVYEPYC